MAQTSMQELKGTQLTAKEQVKQTVGSLIAKNEVGLRAALPAHINPDRLLKLALTATISTPRLVECTIPSLFGAIIQTAELGLEPNTTLGLSFLVPFRNNAGNRTDCKLLLGYPGLIELIGRAKAANWAVGRAVYERDVFEYEFGSDEHLLHKPSRGKRGEITDFYGLAEVPAMDSSGRFSKVFWVMSREEMDEVKAGALRRSYNPAQSPWSTHYRQMGEKTALRRVVRWLRKSPELIDGRRLARAAQLDERADANVSQGFAWLGAKALAGEKIDAEDYDVPGMDDQEGDGEQAGEQQATTEQPSGTPPGEASEKPAAGEAVDTGKKKATPSRKKAAPPPAESGPRPETAIPTSDAGQSEHVTYSGLVDAIAKAKKPEDVDALLNHGAAHLNDDDYDNLKLAAGARHAALGAAKQRTLE